MYHRFDSTFRVYIVQILVPEVTDNPHRETRDAHPKGTRSIPANDLICESLVWLFQGIAKHA